MLVDPGRFIMVITLGLVIRGDRMQMQIFAVEQSILAGVYPCKLKG
jgi:hypothetical protein